MSSQNDKSKLGHRASLGLQIDRFNEQHYVFEGNDEQIASDDHRALLVPQGQLRRKLRILIDPRLELLGVVMTMFDSRTKLANQVVDEVRQHFGERVFETMIPRSTRLAEAPSFGKPIIHYDKYSSGSAAYEVLAQEFLNRVGI